MHPLYDRLARYAIAVLDFVEGLEDFLDPDSRNFWFSWLSWFFSILFWLSALLVFMVVALTTQCPQYLLFIFSVAGLVLLSVPLSFHTVELLRKSSGLNIGLQIAIYIWTQCLIELTVRTPFYYHTGVTTNSDELRFVFKLSVEAM